MTRLALEKIEIRSIPDSVVGLSKSDLLCLLDAAAAADGKSGGAPVLFTGPGRTAKILAAATLALEAGLPLYRVDLGGLTGRYIGETEKSLAALLREAERTASVLVLDEADALFGNRTTTSDSTHRYANLETGYRLARIAAHPGIVVLASNAKNAFAEPVTSSARCTIEFAGDREID